MSTNEAAHDVGRTALIIRVYHGLHGASDSGLTRAQVFSAILIVASVAVAIVGTEPTIRDTSGMLLPTLETAFVGVFVCEYALRVWSIGADSRYAGLAGRLRYMVTPYAVLDMLSILPFLLGWGAQSLLIRLLRLFRLLALSRLLRYSEAMRLVLRAIYDRRYELTFAMALASFVIVLSAGALYSAEADAQPEVFGSIPRALWWSITTLTTVGYGDIVPITPLGKFFAALTALAGIGLIAMPTGILAAAFSQAFKTKNNS